MRGGYSRFKSKFKRGYSKVKKFGRYSRKKISKRFKRGISKVKSFRKYTRSRVRSSFKKGFSKLKSFGKYTMNKVRSASRYTRSKFSRAERKKTPMKLEGSKKPNNSNWIPLVVGGVLVTAVVLMWGFQNAFRNKTTKIISGRD